MKHSKKKKQFRKEQEIYLYINASAAIYTDIAAYHTQIVNVTIVCTPFFSFRLLCFHLPKCNIQQNRVYLATVYILEFSLYRAIQNISV